MKARSPGERSAGSYHTPHWKEMERNGVRLLFSVHGRNGVRLLFSVHRIAVRSSLRAKRARFLASRTGILKKTPPFFAPSAPFSPSPHPIFRGGALLRAQTVPIAPLTEGLPPPSSHPKAHPVLGVGTPRIPGGQGLMSTQGGPAHSAQPPLSAQGTPLHSLTTTVSPNCPNPDPLLLSPPLMPPSGGVGRFCARKANPFCKTARAKAPHNNPD